jgi:methyl coenzyme M reductase subunit D
MENTQTKVNVSLGYTMNVGNFQSLRIDIGVEDQLRDGEQVQDGFDRVYGFVEQQLAAKLKEAQSEIVE